MTNISVYEALERGEQAYQMGDFQSAQEMYNAVLLVDTENSLALHNLGCILEKKGDLSTSSSLFRKALNTVR